MIKVAISFILIQALNLKKGKKQSLTGTSLSGEGSTIYTKIPLQNAKTPRKRRHNCETFKDSSATLTFGGGS